MPESRRGLLSGIAAYLMWGAFPIYWPLLEPAGAYEMVSQRIVWSLLTMAVIVVLMRRVTQVRALWHDRRSLALLVVAGGIITVNWTTYIWGVTNGKVVETSLGYFINPLVTVLMGVLILGERLRRLQWAALCVGALAVVILTVDYGRPPWVALVLACTFGTYGLIKKQADVGAVESLTVETLVIAPLAAAYLLWLASTGDSHFTTEGARHTLLVISSGIATAIPLICFGAAATRVPMVHLGLLQYLAPILQFTLGITYFDEHMPAGRWIGFVLVWVALAAFTAESLHHRRQVKLYVDPTAL